MRSLSGLSVHEPVFLRRTHLGTRTSSPWVVLGSGALNEGLADNIIFGLVYLVGY